MIVTEDYVRNELNRLEAIEKERTLTEEEDVALFYAKESMKLVEAGEWIEDI